MTDDHAGGFIKVLHDVATLKEQRDQLRSALLDVGERLLKIRYARRDCIGCGYPTHQKDCPYLAIVDVIEKALA